MCGVGFKIPQLVRSARVTREVLAKRIIEMAQQGVKDPQTLAVRAERFLCANYSHGRNRRG